MADQELLYFRPDAANEASDAESTGRQVTIGGEEVEVKRQRVVDPAVLAALQDTLAVIEQDAGQRTVFDYYVPAGSANQQIRYFGSAEQDVGPDVGGWTIKRLTWELMADGADHITDLQTLMGVWDDRSLLNWS